MQYAHKIVTTVTSCAEGGAEGPLAPPPPLIFFKRLALLSLAYAFIFTPAPLPSPTHSRMCCTSPILASKNFKWRVPKHVNAFRL